MSFIVAILVLVTVHEWGHYAVARLCGVKVFQFSVGFGPRLWGWTSASSGTEFVIGLLPLGGFVRMLDEREGPVEPHERAMAFNLQALYKKVAIVLAGPVANLLLAIALYSCVNWIGVDQPLPIVARPPPDSVLAAAHFVGGERVQRVGFVGDELEDVASFEDFRWWLTRAAIAHRNLQIEYTGTSSHDPQTAVVALDTVDASKADAKLFEKIGASAPFSQARIGELIPGGAAEQAHLQVGDVVLRVDTTDIVDSAQLFEIIRGSGRNGTPVAQTWVVARGDARLSLAVEPKLVREQDHSFGRIGAALGAPLAMAIVRYGPLDGIRHAVTRTWETSALSLRIMGQIVLGQASLRNLSGPVSIAKYAGKSASMGLTQYLLFLALISVSLGVLNLLPLPILDGGHLMYYLWEALSGKPVSQLWTERLQKLGFVILMMMMSVAMVNDLTPWPW